MNKESPLQSMYWPVSVAVMGVVLVALFFLSPSTIPHAAPLSEEYPTPTNTTYIPPATKTPTNTSEPTDTAESTDTPTPTDTPTATKTQLATTQDDEEEEEEDPTETPTVTTAPKPTDTPKPTATPEEEKKEEDKPTTTPTPTTTELPLERDCSPGNTVLLKGENAPPMTSLVIFFEGRPVGGGMSDHDGHYLLYMEMGEERTLVKEKDTEVRSYSVEVRERGKPWVVQTAICLIGTPTPLPTPDKP